MSLNSFVSLGEMRLAGGATHPDCQSSSRLFYGAVGCDVRKLWEYSSEGRGPFPHDRPDCANGGRTGALLRDMAQVKEGASASYEDPLYGVPG